MRHITANQALVRIERTLPAPPHQVYRAWLEPALIRRWMAPGSSYEVTKVEVDERVGGQYRIWQSNAGRSVGGFECQILELVPNERIVWRWGFTGPDRENGPTYDSQMTITLRDAPPAATALTLVQEQLDDLAAALPQVAAKVDAGWDNVITKLAAALTDTAQ